MAPFTDSRTATEILPGPGEWQGHASHRQPCPRRQMMSSTLIRLRRTDSDQRAMCAHGKSFKCQAECSGSGRIEPPGLVYVRSAGSSFSSVRIQKNVSSRKFRPRRSVIGSARCMSLLPKKSPPGKVNVRTSTVPRPRTVTRLQRLPSLASVAAFPIPAQPAHTVIFENVRELGVSAHTMFTCSNTCADRTRPSIGIARALLVGAPLAS
jgi:hypothetical protein